MPQQSSMSRAASGRQHSLHIDNADSGLALLLQNGVRIDCTTGIPLMDLLHDELRLSPEQTGKLDVFLLDGKPVDTPRETPVPGGARLALAAGLPGIAGLAMKSNSAVRGLRPGITHGVKEDTPDEPQPGPGHIELVLYSLALKELARHFLAHGVTLQAGKLLGHLPEQLRGDCNFDGKTLDGQDALGELKKLPPDSPVRFSAHISQAVSP